MGFIKDVGSIAGKVAGLVVGAPIAIVGEAVDSDFLKEVGDGVFKASSRTGELLGNAAEGAAETIYGTVTEDKAMQSNGINKVVDSGATYAKGVINGTVKMVGNGIETACAIMDGDTDKAVKVGKEIVKTALVATVAFTVADVIDGLDDLGDSDNDSLIAFDDDYDNDGYIENPNIHHVTPHERTLASGRTIWVDGDGDTSVDTYDGWYQSNPDYRA